ncbi:hypothetical protein GGH99_006137 [Coemansia sp. RSA 1285]|nr:hypothetical protein GGH99_006137 [Coemansia sp. RSA 1285]
MADYSLWSAPLSRRSVSLLQSHAIRPDHLESIGEDSDGIVYRPAQDTSTLQEGPYNAGDRAVLRSTRYVPGMQSTLHQPFYLPSPFYPFAYGSANAAATNAWSRQGSFSYFAGPSTVSGHPAQGLMSGGRQIPRGSVDASMALRGINSNGSGYIGLGPSISGSALLGAESSAPDAMQIDALYKLVYRLNIIAVEPDANTVLPSFEYFVSHQAVDLTSYRIHRASTVSIASTSQLQSQPQLQVNKQQHSVHRSASLVNSEDALSTSTLRRDGTDKRPSISTYPISSEISGVADDDSAGVAEHTLLEDSRCEARARSASPTPLAHPLPRRNEPPLHRHTRSASPAVSAAQLSNPMSDSRSGHTMHSASYSLPLQPALNEPPTPLYLSEAMSQQHLIAILGMVVRQFECAVDSLEAHVDDDKDVINTQLCARNDSMMDEKVLCSGAALRNALGQVANNSHGLDNAGFEWTRERVLDALEAYIRYGGEKRTGS